MGICLRRIKTTLKIMISVKSEAPIRLRIYLTNRAALSLAAAGRKTSCRGDGIICSV